MSQNCPDVCLKQPENGKWTLKIEWILDLLMEKPLHLFKTKIMMITIHQIQAG